MTFYVVEGHEPFYIISEHDTERKANNACKKRNDIFRLGYADYSQFLAEKFCIVVNSEDFAKSLKRTKKVRNLMTGEEIEIDVNTPLSCDPSSETYWSM